MSNSLLITNIADYGIGDGAFLEVSQRLLLEIPEASIRTLSVPPFDTLATGFWNAQLGLNPGPIRHIIYHNCAPRKDDLLPRHDNEGEGLTYALLPNGVVVIGVNAGFALSFIKDHALSLRSINVPKDGSQFRSRDLFPQAVAALSRGDDSLLGEELQITTIPDLPEEQITWIDGYGNLKLTIPDYSLRLRPGDTTNIKIGSVTAEAVFADGSFTVPEGTLAFAPGSSGWTTPNGQRQFRWMELFLRGGSAWKTFNRPCIGTKVTQKLPRRQDTESEFSLSYTI